MRAAIILAAGASRRFGRSDKLHARLGLCTLLQHAVCNAQAAGARRILVVRAMSGKVARLHVPRRKPGPRCCGWTGRRLSPGNGVGAGGKTDPHEPYRPAGVAIIRAQAWRDGLSASLAAGLAALRPIEREVLIFLADMPFARAPQMRLAAGFDAARPAFGSRRGHPVLVRTQAAKVALGSGDKGLAGRLKTSLVPGTAANLFDIDTQDALRRARRHGSRALWLRSANG